MSEQIEINLDELSKAANSIADFCLSQGINEILGYMAMKYLTKLMSESLDSEVQRKIDLFFDQLLAEPRGNT